MIIYLILFVDVTFPVDVMLHAPLCEHEEAHSDLHSQVMALSLQLDTLVKVRELQKLIFTFTASTQVLYITGTKTVYM